jgi:hypothetical protein
MIDHYILIGFLTALILKSIDSNTIKKGIFLAFTVCCIGLNFAQAYQIRYGILTGGSATPEQYWDNFLSFEKKAQVYPHNHWVLEESQSLNLTPQDPYISKGHSYFFEGAWCIQVTSYDKYSAAVEMNLQQLRKGSKIKIEFEARARDLIEETRAVVSLDENRQVFSLSPYLKKDEWVKIEYLIEPQIDVKNSPVLYFWNGGSEEKVEFIKKIIPDFKHLRDN